jgi:hypothetical protein
MSFRVYNTITPNLSKLLNLTNLDVKTLTNSDNPLYTLSSEEYVLLLPTFTGTITIPTVSGTQKYVIKNDSNVNIVINTTTPYLFDDDTTQFTLPHGVSLSIITNGIDNVWYNI